MAELIRCKLFTCELLGSFSLIWCCIWSLFVFDSPEEHPHISTVEKQYIEGSVRLLTSMFVEQDYRAPWMAILTCPAFWAVVVVHLCYGCNMHILIESINKYLLEVHFFDIRETTTMAALPYFGEFIVSIVSGTIYDFVVSEQLCSTTTARKIGVSIALLVPAALILRTFMLDCTGRVEATYLIIAAIACSGLHVGSGFLTNVVDIAPPHAAIMFGLSATISDTSVFIILTCIKLMSESNTYWSIQFLTMAILNILGCVIFMVFGSGFVQDWVHVSDDEITPPFLSFLHVCESEVTSQTDGV